MTEDPTVCEFVEVYDGIEEGRMMVVIAKLGNNKELKPQDKQTKRQEKGLTKQEVESHLQKSEKLSQKGIRLVMSDKIHTYPFSTFFTSSFVTVLAKTCIFVPKLNSILLPQLTDTLNIYPSPVYQVLNVNWSAFVKGILPTLQSHSWNNGTHGGYQLGSEDLGLLPLAMWPTIV